MNDRPRCTHCGTTLDEGAGEGHCPACMLELALEPSEPAEGGAGAPELQPGAVVGPFTVVRAIGEGGMGRVYLAEQAEPVARQVALKVIKHGMDTEQVVARFDIERQALALMDHPSIARVLDAGRTDSGLPYFAMDYIEGSPITDYCDRKRLSLRRRLELFLQVCDAVQHAHRKGIIHRDIKPSNVMVTEQDGAPLAKVIDFGVAKAIEQRLTERSLFTEVGVLIGTPEYMSPEQAELKLIDVDTRTDVYSLGVLLYNLITGFLPLEGEDLRKAGLGEILRRIREDRPSRPSTRISEAGERAIDPAKLRRLDVSGLRRLVAGDLDIITLKALEKDRERRYGSPAELASDITRHLNDEPVLAQPPSAVYNLRKWVQRNTLAAVMTAAILIGVVAVGIVMTVLYRDAKTNLERALEAEATQREVSRFMVNVFEVADPNIAQGTDVTARELLDEATERISSELDGQPRVQAMLMAKMGEVHVQLGLHEQAGTLLTEAVEDLDQLFGRENQETLHAIASLGQAQNFLGNWEDAERLLSEALAAQERLLGGDHVDTLVTRGNLGTMYHDLGRLEEAERELATTLAAERRVFGSEYQQTLFTMNNLAQVLISQGRFDDAEALLDEALATFDRVFGADHPGRIYVLDNLSRSKRGQKDFEAAEPYLTEMVETSERLLGPTHLQTLGGLNGLAIFYAQQGKFEQAEPYWVEAIRRQREIGREDHPDTLSYAGNLAYMYSEMGKPEKAEPLLVDVLERKQRTMGMAHQNTLNTVMNLSMIYTGSGRSAQAETLLRETLAAWRDNPEQTSPMVGVGFYFLGNVLRDDGRLDEAEAAYDESERILTDLVDEDHPYLANSRSERAKLYRLQGRDDEADALDPPQD